MEIVKDSITRKVTGKLFLPFYNLWNSNVYYQDQPFEYSPTFIRSNSTSGSPVIMGNNFFIGCLNPHADAVFKYDGTNLICQAGPQQDFFYSEGDPREIWQEYNLYVSQNLPHKNNSTVPTLNEIEYCTWVEQKKFASKEYNDDGMTGAVRAMNDEFIDDYLRRIDKMNLPRGVFTLDHGWIIGSDTFDFGIPQPDTSKFKDFSETIRRISNAGFLPGIWFAPAFLYPDNDFFETCPEAKGEMFTGANEGGFQFPLHYFEVTPETSGAIYNHFVKIFKPYLEMGVMKLKIDFTYNNKSKMIKILELLYKAVKCINPAVEVEGHIPDIFATPYQDAVRLNDIVIETNPEWEKLFDVHYDVCLNSALQTQLNLDHVGTNSPNICEQDFLKSMEQFKGKKGYPVISLLPDHFSNDTVAKVRDYLTGYVEENALTMC